MDSINSALQKRNYSPLTLVLGGAAAGLLLRVVYKDIIKPGDYFVRARSFGNRVIRVVAQGKIQSQIDKSAAAIKFDAIPAEHLYGTEAMCALPEKGLPAQEIVMRSKGVASKLHRSFEKGIFSGTVYLATPELTNMVNEVQSIFQWTNPLHPETFPGCRLMECQVVSMCVTMYRGKLGEACGTVTSGGTESIMMAMKTYRDWGLDKKWITEPEIVLPATAHPAFNKAAQYFHLRIRVAGIDEKTGRVDIAQVKRLVNSNTVAIVGSCPNWPNGAIDDIPALAAIARSTGCGMHVDACLGSFVVPFLREDVKALTGIEGYDFAIEGVTSISCDTHKFGGAPKGTSVLMYASQALRRYQYYTISSWPGGIYASPGMAGSRPGNVIAGAWAAMMYYGREGYRKNALEIVAVARRFAAAISAIPELQIYGQPVSTTICFVAKDPNTFDILRLYQLMKEKGYDFNMTQFPSAFNICFTLMHTFPGNLEKIIESVKDCVAQMRAKPSKASGAVAMYGSTQTVHDRTIVEDVMKFYFDHYYDLQNN